MIFILLYLLTVSSATFILNHNHTNHNDDE